MVKTQLFIDMLEAGRVTSVTSAHGTTRTSRSPLDMSVHWGEAVMLTSRLKRRE
jgi:hypothetical protein